jgi:hypothetical protein
MSAGSNMILLYSTLNLYVVELGVWEKGHQLIVDAL